MQTLLVVIVGPIRDAGSGVIEAEEQGLVEKLISYQAVKTLAEIVLHGFTGCDEVPGMFCSCAQASMAFDVNSVPLFRDDHIRLAALFD